ncbi:FN3 associated domain-containing protein [uncultured Sphaerochaeta sp.]|uniref:FN3 associated domain-containing protein n=1 Tax=uncultured Sphaerochaeta sp. TaxID=886478 RepID=UPI002A0A8D5E|nr:FN3 associated domain-containing protein [uncultured Sphaerochaeta sp.]
MKRLRVLSFPMKMYCLLLIIVLALSLVSCSEPSMQGDLEISFPDSSSKSIVPTNTAVTWVAISGSLNGSSDVKFDIQYFELGKTISIKGLSAGTWTINVTGYNGNPTDSKTAVLTGSAIDDDVTIRSGSTTRAVFALHYLDSGKGLASVMITWPNTSVRNVLLTAKAGASTVGSSAVSVDSTLNSAVLELSNLDVGNYDLDVTLTNASGTTMAFPMIDMLSVFADLKAEGTISLVDADVPRVVSPVISVTADGPSITSRTVSIVSATPNTTIYYTLDDSVPQFADGVPGANTLTYTQPFAITSPVTIVTTLAARNGYQDSESICSGELTVGGSDDGGVVISQPSLISNVLVTSMNEVYLEDPSFAVSYDLEGSPILDSVLWYLDGTSADDTDNDDSYTYTGFLPAGRRQVSVKILYHDGTGAKTALGTLRFNNNGQVATPVVVASGSDSSMQVSIASATPTTSIYYTTDSSVPTVASKLYTEPFSVAAKTTITTIAMAVEYRDSVIVSALVDGGSLSITTPSTVSDVIVQIDTLRSRQPQFSVGYEAVNVSGETVTWYLDDDTQPLTDQDGDAVQTTCTYGGTLEAGRHQITAKITYNDGTRTQVASGLVRFDLEQVLTPEITTVQADNAKQVTLSCATAGSTIYYTTDGNLPDVTNSNQLYSGPFVVSLGKTVKAIAAKVGLADSATAEKTMLYAVGDTGPSGGLIFFVDTNNTYSGWTYLEAAASDEGDHIWGGDETALGASVQRTAIGTGEENTSAITAILDASETDYAAKICENKTVTYNGTTYSDWFLPSRDELDALYTCWNDTGKGSFATVGYWSSTEDNAYIAWMQNFTDGIQNDGNGNGSKSILNRVRAVRSF